MTLWKRVYEERRSMVVPLVIALAVNAAVFVLAVLPLRRIVATSQIRAAEATVELGTARQVERQARDARASRDRAADELKKFYEETLPADASSAQKITNYWLQEAARGTGLTFRGSRFQSDPVEKSRLTRAFSRVTLQGRYPNIRRFLHEVETAQEFIVVERVELAQTDQASTNGLLEVSLVVTTYYIASPTP
jgi:Tfp pilus assembly protein PilO